MPLPRLFVVRSDLRGRWDTEYQPTDAARYGGAPTCPECGVFIGSRKWLDPLRASLTVHGDGPGDFAFSGGDFLVSESAVETLRDQKVKAFTRARPVQVAASRGWPIHDLPKYVYPEVPIGPAADLARTVILSDRRSPCDWCGPNAADAVGSICIDWETWEDLDLFVPRRLPGLVVVTQTLVDAVRHAELTGIEFIEAERHRWDPLNLLGR